MFRDLAYALQGNPRFVVPPAPPPLVDAAANQILTGHHPRELADAIEFFWQRPRLAGVRNYGDGFQANDHRRFSSLDDVDANFLALAAVAPPPPPVPGLFVLPTAPRFLGDVWFDHICYAYLIESTNIVNIFRRVIELYVTSEELPPANFPTQRWLHATEQLFFSRPRSDSVRLVTSDIRPDETAVRRNCYYRLLGMDVPEAQQYPYVRPRHANREFPTLFERLLREVWLAYANRNNSVGADTTDTTSMEELIRRIRELLLARRTFAAMTREEYDAVVMMSWFHLTVEANTSPVVTLNAIAPSPAERLKKIAARVGVPMHSRADSFFQMADAMSRVLMNIENDKVAAVALFNPPLVADLLLLINHWSLASGRDLKAPAREYVAPRDVTYFNGDGARAAAVTRELAQLPA